MTFSDLRKCIRVERRANAGYPKSQCVLFWLRVTQFFGSKGRAGRILYVPLAVVYKLVTEWQLGIEIPPSTKIGVGLRVMHGVGLVVNPHAVIGERVVLRQGVTIGNRKSALDCPVIEDDVEIGAGAIILGAIRIGAGARIGAGSVIVTDVPAGAVTIPQRATIIQPK